MYTWKWGDNYLYTLIVIYVLYKKDEILKYLRIALTDGGASWYYIQVSSTLDVHRGIAQLVE